MSTMVTIEEMKKVMPLKSNFITQEAVDIINESQNDPEFQGESLLQSASIYESVLKGSRSSVPEYLNAVRFCAYMMTNDSNYTEAYKKVFVHRPFVQDRVGLPTGSSKYAELTSAASRYRRTKLVVDILTVSQVPLDMIFAGARYKALAALVDVIENGQLDKDVINASKELLAATAGPENIKIELDIGVKEDSAVQALNDQLATLATRQHDLLTAGVATLEQMGNMKVVNQEDAVEGEFTDATN